MKGSIYTAQKCFECGGVVKYVEGRGILACQEHPKVVWLNNCEVRFGKEHHKRFKTVAESERHLTYLRVQTDKGQFDQREWAKDQPLSFYALRKKFLAHKKKDGIGKKQIQHITHVLNVAGKAWDQMQIKEIAEPEIEDFFDDLKASGKTKKNYQTVLHNFWAWVVRREKWILFPDTKEGIPKFIHLLPEHADLIREIRGPKGMPDMYFFRHVKAKPSVKAGTRFGQKQFRMWWNRACKNLNIEGVDLYGGTKHSTVTALGQVLTPEQIQRGVTGHISDAFKRYMLPDKNDAIQGEPKQFNRCNLKMITS